VLAAAGTGTAGTAASLIATVAPAGAQSIGDCSTTIGVIVVVDFSHWGRTIERGCAADGSTNGLQALHTAGFTTTGVAAYGTAFICRIDTKPTTTQTSCTKTPPSTGYWSYWHAIAGQTTWSYSSLGVRTYEPAPGSVTLWTFGGTNVTGTSGTGRPPATLTPTALRATNTTPSGGGSGGGGSGSGGGGPAKTTATAPPPTTTTSSSTTTTVSPGPTPTGVTGTAPPVAGSPTSTTPTTGTTTTTTTTGGKAGGTGSHGAGGPGSEGGGSQTGTKGGGGTRIVDVDPTAARLHPSSGSPLPVIIGGIAVVAVAGAATVVAWRRRRASQTGRAPSG
jgi:hypothetical protein